MSLSRKGDLLASGGMDGVRLWYMNTWKQLKVPHQNLAQRGPVTSMLWITRRHDVQEILCHGTANGYLVIWVHQEGEFVETASRRLGTGEEILSIARDEFVTQSQRLVIGTRGGLVVGIEVDIKNEMISAFFSIKLSPTIPKGVAFAEDSENIYVFGLYEGDILTLRTKDGKILSSQNIGTPIGNVAINYHRGHFVVDNTVDGFTVLELEDKKFIRSLSTGIPSKRLPKQVAVSEEGRIVVGGSDHGVVYVFEESTGSVLDILSHEEQGLVQTIETHDSKDIHIIISATTTPNTDSVIYIWQYKSPKPTIKRPSKKNAISWANNIFHLLLRIIVVFAALAFLCQNLDWIPPYMSAVRMSYFAPVPDGKAQELPYVDRRYATDNPVEEIESLRRLLQAVEEEKLVLLMRRDNPKVPIGSVKETASLQEAMEGDSDPISADRASPKKTAQVGTEKLLAAAHLQTEIECADR